MKVVLQLVTMVALVSATLFYTYNGVETEKDSEKTKDCDDLLEGYSVSDLLEKEIELVKKEKKLAKLKQIRDEHKAKELEKLRLIQVEKEKREAKKRIVATRAGVNKGIFTATAYDLTVASCGKSKSHPQYGITASGVSLKGHTLESIRAIAVDPKVIKLGSKVYIEFFDEGWKHLNGEYTAVDTGGAIKGNIIDVFFGSGNVKDEVKQFGRREATVTIISRP